MDPHLSLLISYARLCPFGTLRPFWAQHLSMMYVNVSDVIVCVRVSIPIYNLQTKLVSMFERVFSLVTLLKQEAYIGF